MCCGKNVIENVVTGFQINSMQNSGKILNSGYIAGQKILKHLSGLTADKLDYIGS
jgi:hypothetical protein